MTTDADTLITSHAEFRAALNTGFAEAARGGSRELWLCDTDFADWPLGERAVIEQLTAWAASNRRLTLVAHRFDAVARIHPRWVEWRRTWSHIVSCRANDEVGGDDFPVVLLASGCISMRLSNVPHHRGRLSRSRAEELHCRELIDAVLQRSQESFPATTTGL